MMAGNMGRLWTVIGFLLAGCSVQSEQDDLTTEIAQSIRVGDEAADAKPGYGFDLYPGAEVTSSLMDGMSLTIQTDDNLPEIVSFYEDQFVEKGWQLEVSELNERRATLSGARTGNQKETMKITVAETERGQGQYHLIFMKLISDQ